MASTSERGWQYAPETYSDGEVSIPRDPTIAVGIVHEREPLDRHAIFRDLLVQDIDRDACARLRVPAFYTRPIAPSATRAPMLRAGILGR